MVPAGKLPVGTGILDWVWGVSAFSFQGLKVQFWLNHWSLFGSICWECWITCAAQPALTEFCSNSFSSFPTCAGLHGNNWIFAPCWEPQGVFLKHCWFLCPRLILCNKIKAILIPCVVWENSRWKRISWLMSNHPSLLQANKDIFSLFPCEYFHFISKNPLETVQNEMCNLIVFNKILCPKASP